jgi:hypothetical protein
VYRAGTGPSLDSNRSFALSGLIDVSSISARKPSCPARFGPTRREHFGSSRCALRSDRPRCGGPFLKESVKRKRFSSGWFHNGSAGRKACILRVRCSRSSLRFFAVSFSGFVSVVVATGSCNRSFQRRLLPTHSFARYRSRESRVVLPDKLTRADADVSSANSSPQGPLHPERRAAGFGHRWPQPSHPRSATSWPQREGSQVATGQLRSNNRGESSLLMTPLCLIRFDHPSGTYNTFDLGGGCAAKLASRLAGVSPAGASPHVAP